MTKKNYACWVGRYFGITSVLLLLVACSEEPKQQVEEAKPQVEQATKEAPVAEEKAMVQEDEAKTDLLAALKEAKMALKESETLLRDAPRGKDSDAPLLALERELQAAESLLVDIDKAIDQGDYLKAKGQIQEMNDSTNRVNQQLKQANRKLQRGN